MKIVILQDEQYEKLEHVISAFHGEVHDLEKNAVKGPFKWTVSAIDKPGRPWLTRFSVINNETGYEWGPVIYNNEYRTTKEHNLISGMMYAYRELLNKLNIQHNIYIPGD